MNGTKAKKFRLTDWLLEGILLILIVVFSIIANNFLTIGNLWNIVRSISFKGIIACFVTMSRGRMPRRTRFITARPVSYARLKRRL